MNADQLQRSDFKSGLSQDGRSLFPLILPILSVEPTPSVRLHNALCALLALYAISHRNGRGTSNGTANGAERGNDRFFRRATSLRLMEGSELSQTQKKKVRFPSRAASLPIVSMVLALLEGNKKTSTFRPCCLLFRVVSWIFWSHIRPEVPWYLHFKCENPRSGRLSEIPRRRVSFQMRA